MKKKVNFKNSNQLSKMPEIKAVRLNKFISNAGVCSRREADQLIKLGMVSVNGKIITEMGHKIFPVAAGFCGLQKSKCGTPKWTCLKGQIPIASFSDFWKAAPRAVTALVDGSFCSAVDDDKFVTWLRMKFENFL